MLKASSFFVDRVAIALSILVTIGLLGWTIWSSYYGIDLTDESFYLNWIAHPWLYDTSVMQFGYILNPIFELLGKDVARIRQFNFLLLYFSVFLISYLLLKYAPVVGEKNEQWELFEKIGISVILGSGGLLFFQYFWITVPGYNSLAFVSVCITTSSLVLIYQYPHNNRFGWTLLVIGGWLACMSKPTTAAVLFVITIVFMAGTRSWPVRGLLYAAIMLVALLISSILLIDGSFIEFYARIERGMEWAKILGGGHGWLSLFRIDDFHLRTEQIVNFWVLFLAGYISSLFDYKRYRFGVWVNILLIFVVILISLYNLLFWETLQYPWHRFQVLQIVGFPAGMIVAGLTLAWKDISGLSPRSIALPLALALSPYAFAFGTNNNYWIWEAGAGVFWVLSGISFQLYVVKKTVSFRTILLLAVLVQVSTIIFVNGAMRHPYRQTQPLWLNQNTVAVGSSGSELVIEQETGEYILRLVGMAKQAGFESGTPVIDMTGHYPGALYAMGANPLGAPWLIGGYSGSIEIAFAALERVPCQQIVTAWILDEPAGPRRINDGLLKKFGISIDEDYIAIGRLMGPPGQYQKEYEQVLLKPANSGDEAVYSCKMARADFDGKR